MAKQNCTQWAPTELAEIKLLEDAAYEWVSKNAESAVKFFLDGSDLVMSSRRDEFVVFNIDSPIDSSSKAFSFEALVNECVESSRSGDGRIDPDSAEAYALRFERIAGMIREAAQSRGRP